jgi:hypothetical protein
MEEIPYKLIGELMKKISAKEWIGIYEKNMHLGARKKRKAGRKL